MTSGESFQVLKQNLQLWLWPPWGGGTTFQSWPDRNLWKNPSGRATEKREDH